MLPEHDRVFVAQMIEAAEAALEFSEGMTKEGILADRMVAFAVVRAVQIVGQAARGVSDQSRAVHPERDDLPVLIPRLQGMLEADAESRRG